MANKNPFEIRADMLKLAKDYMDQQYHMNIQFSEKLIEEGKKTADEIKEMYKMYSMNDLMATARDMYDFVSRRENEKE
jgi:hypothetical protein